MTAAAPARFAAGMAAATLALFITAQTSAGVHLATLAILLTISSRGLNDTRALNRALVSIGPALLVVSALTAAAVAIFAGRAWAWDLVRDRSENGIGMRAPSSRQLLLAILSGVALASFYIAVAQYLLPVRPGRGGPLARIAASGPTGFAAFAIVAVLLAPPVEEFLFRGLLLKGFAASWGLKAAASFVSAIFVVMHIPEVVNYWPALLAIIFLTGATLAARLLTGSLGAAIALHAAYNVVIVVMVMIAMY